MGLFIESHQAKHECHPHFNNDNDLDIDLLPDVSYTFLCCAETDVFIGLIHSHLSATISAKFISIPRL